MMKTIAMFLNTSIADDSRVKNMIGTLSKKYEVHLFYINGNDDDHQYFNQNVKLYYQNYTKPRLAYFSFVKEYSFLINIALKTGIVFDYVWANDLPSCYPAFTVGNKLKSKLIFDSHEIFIETVNQFFIMGKNPIKNIGFKFLIYYYKLTGYLYERFTVFNTMDLLVTTNNSYLDFFTKRYGAISNSVIIMNFPKTKIIKESFDFRKHYNWPLDSKIILYQGAYNEGRGLMFFIEVMRVLPAHYKWVLLGYGLLQKEMEEKIKQYGLSDRIVFYGMIHNEYDLIKYTKGGDIGLNLLEAFNVSKKLASANKLFQYMQARIPCIASYSPENTKVLEIDKTGILVENDVEVIKNTILNFPFEQFNEELFAEAEKKYIWESQEERLFQAIDRIK